MTSFSLIEPLEQRIAPALLVNGANLLGGGGGNPTTGESSLGANSVTLVKVLSGNAIVWYEQGIITAISVGPNTSLDLTGNVGDIIANLTASGRLSDSDGNPANGEDGNVLLANNILGIKTHPLGGQNGDVDDIISGGSVSNLSISGEIHGVFAGDGVFRAGSHALTNGAVDAFVFADVNPVLVGAQSSFHLTKAGSQLASGASISNAQFQTAKELQVYAGNGFAGAPGKPGGAGGSVQNVTITSAFIGENSSGNTPSYDIQAGDGGNGKTGGAGGSVVKIIEKTSSGVVNVTAGRGGDGSAGAGGAGGSVKGLDMQSDSSSYTVAAGQGGSGAPGGAGGTIAGNNFSGKAPGTGLIVSADFTGDGIDDILVVDSGTGKMIVEKNSGDGSSFTQVVQDDRDTPQTQDDLIEIAPKGTTPDSVVAVDVNGDGKLDIVVSYKNSNNLGVYLNRGGGVFYDQTFDQGVYTGSAPSGTTVDLGHSPFKIAAGNFTGSDAKDIAVLVTNTASSEVYVAVGDGTGGFALLDSAAKLNRLATDIVTAPINADVFSDLFVGFQSGEIRPLLATGAATGDAFTVGNAGLSMTGGVANLDVDAGSHRLLALSITSPTLGVFSFGSTGLLSAAIAPDLSQQTGRALVAHFVNDNISAEAPIEVLSVLSSGSRLDTYTEQGNVFGVVASVQSASTLKNFVPVIEGASTGVAALGGSLGHFSFSESAAAFVDFALPFNGKKVSLFAGDGGDGVDFSANHIGKGGAGGGIFGSNIEAGDIFLRAGNGGASGKGAGGAGGSIINGAAIPASTGLVAPVLAAESSVVIIAGNGGAPTAAAPTAVGGSGGNVSSLNLSIVSGGIQINGGMGANGQGGAGGAGGNVTNLAAVSNDGDFLVKAGDGGAATGGKTNGGAGGALTNVKYTLDLPAEVETLEKSYEVNLTAGSGGASAGGVGGAGGALGLVNLTLDPSDESFDDPSTPGDEHADVDSTLHVFLSSGDGGDGATGGAGGAIKSVQSTTTFDQFITDPITKGRSVELNPIVMSIIAGHGGVGTTGAGGVGGSIALGGSLNGVTGFDFDFPSAQSPLYIQSGDGGSGATKGGAGGAIASVITGNSPASDGSFLAGNELLGAKIVSGDGGSGGTSDGGAGGAVSLLSLGVDFGPILIQSGSGGAGGTTSGSHLGKGGAAGNIINSTLGSMNSGVGVLAGTGGDGVAGGGSGGTISLIKLNAPQDSSIFTSIFRAGDGGLATGDGVAAGKGFIGGKGGDVTGLSQTKDLNSAINLIQAGDGGGSAGQFGVGGAGGNVANIQTVGMIGLPSDDFSPLGAFSGSLAQGVFSGRGGVGSKTGVAGSVASVVARQIAAIGASADVNGVFGLASKISNIKADLIGFDVDGDGAFDSTSPGLSPSAAQPIDGFILASAISSINTLNNSRTTAFEFTA